MSELQWFSSNLSALYWMYLEHEEGTEGHDNDEDGGDDENDDDFQDFGDFKAQLRAESVTTNEEKLCEIDSEIPVLYRKSDRMGLLGN